MIWQRSWFYRLWVIGGLLAVAGVVLYVGLTTEPGDSPPYVLFGVSIGVYLLGILVMQGIDLGRRPEPAGEVPAGEVPRTPEQLLAALTLPGADGARSRAGAEGSRRFSIGLFIPTALVAVLLPLGGYLYVTGTVSGVWQPLGETGPGIPVAALPGLVVVLVLLAMLPTNLRKARGLSDDYFSGTGLAISRTPSVILLPRIGTDGVGAHTVGPTTFEGQRYGRHVVVQAYAGSTAVLVAAPTPAFEAVGEDKRLRLISGPAHVQAVLDAIAEDPRWKRVRISGDQDGVRVNRRGSAVDSDWMLDLWLAEQVAAG